MNIQYIETIEEAVEYVKNNYNNPTCSDIRSLCEAVFSFNGFEIGEDNLMIEFNLGE